MVNKISVVLDVATEKAISGLKGFKQSVADADGAFGKIKAGSASAFDSVKANAGVAGVAVVGAVGAMAAKSIEAASRLGESVNAVNVTFGQSAAGIKALGEEAAESVGLSNAAFNGLAVQFSSFAQTIAGEGGDVVATIDEMSTRAADFASVMNIDVADAASIFQSGLAGETEPLKKFGIDLSAAAVEAYALSKGIATAGESMTEAQKVQARYGLLMEQTEKTAGDFANTSGGLANSQRILSAKMEDTAAKAGKQLAPALAAVTSALSDMIPIAGTAAVKVGNVFTGLTEVAYDLGAAYASVAEKIPGVTLSGEGIAVQDTLHDLEAMEAGAQGLVEKYAKAGMTVDEFSAVLAKNGVEFTANNMATVAYAKTLEDTTPAVDENTKSLAELASEAIVVGLAVAGVNEVIEDAEAAQDALEAAEQRLIDTTNELTNQYSELKGELSAEEDFLAAETMWADLEQSAVDSYTAASEGAEDAAQKAADHKQAVIDAKQQVVELGDRYRELPKESITRIVALIDAGQLQAAEDQLAILSRNRTSNIYTVAHGGAGYIPPGGVGATGGIVTRPTMALIGEAGPEAVVPLNQMPGASPLPNGVGGGSPVYVTVNAGMGADGREIGDIIVGKIREYERRNGNGWRG